MVFLVDDLAKHLLGELASKGFKQIKSLWGFGSTDGFEKLRETVSTIQAVVLDAEDKKSRNREIDDWIGKIKDGLYQAQDLLDEIWYEDLRRMVLTRNKSLKELRVFCSSSNKMWFRLRIGYKMRKLQERLDFVASQRTKFHLVQRLENDMMLGKRREDTETHSYVARDKIVGREKDERYITELLLGTAASEDNIAVFSITGIGGLGKTALAQAVFNCEKIKGQFEIAIWVYVSQSFSVRGICENIVRRTTGKTCQEWSLDELRDTIKKALDGKVYLLVLDDVWVEDQNEWSKLQEMLAGGARGSKVLVTTRNRIVAETTKSAAVYDLKGLSDEDSWSCFKRKAFKNGLEPENPVIVEIAKEALQKCAGVPLAIQLLGGFLYGYEDDLDAWMRFRTCDLPNIIRSPELGVMPILKLSYDYLPSRLKGCFIYCAVLPKGATLQKGMLIKMWIAHGMIPLPGESQNLEAVGEKYFNELLRRSFIQVTEPCSYREDEYGIHDLLHELAHSIEGNELGIIYVEGNHVGATTRHLFLQETFYSREDILCRSKKLRTLIIKDGWFGYNILQDVMSSCKGLRVLQIQQCRKVPRGVGELIHLCYLDLSGSSFFSLPEAICYLCNLQTLKINECKSLQTFPRRFKDLVSLRHLEIRRCMSLRHMPYKISTLTNLQTLNKFVVGPEGKYHSGELAELESLVNLRGKVLISDLRGSILNSCERRLDHPLTKLKYVSAFSLKWLPFDGKGWIENGLELRLLENLKPHSNLKKLKIQEYPARRFPSWMGERDCLPNIVEITLHRCSGCRHLPSLGLLPNLEVLKVSMLNSLEYVYEEEDSYSNDADVSSSSSSSQARQLFTSLKCLYLICNSELKGLGKRKKIGSIASSSSSAQHFPALELLHICDCRKLGLFCVNENENEDGKLLQGAPLSELSISGADFVCIPNWVQYLSRLESLALDEVDLEILPDWLDNFTSLKFLGLRTCLNLTSLPSCLRHLTSLQLLEVIGCRHLEERCKEETGKDWPKIVHIPRIVQKEAYGVFDMFLEWLDKCGSPYASDFFNKPRVSLVADKSNMFNFFKLEKNDAGKVRVKQEFWINGNGVF